MPISVTNIRYEPTAWAEESGAPIVFDFDVSIECDDGTIPYNFYWRIDLRDEDLGWYDGKDGIQVTEGSSQVHVNYSWSNPNIPPGGARPYIMIVSSCTEVYTTGYCTGITKVLSVNPIVGGGSGKCLITLSRNGCSSGSCRNSSR